MAAETLALLRDRGAEIREHLVTDVVELADGPALLRDVAAHRRRVLTAVLRMPGG
jgi:hypothetical protein